MSDPAGGPAANRPAGGVQHLLKRDRNRSRSLRVFPIVAALLIGALPAGCARTPASPVVRAEEPWFENVAIAAGIDFKHINGASGQFYYPETNGSGCAFFDADGDRKIDIFLVNAAPLPGFTMSGTVTSALYLNIGDGEFRNATSGSGLESEMYGTGCAAGDFDNDGRNDLYVANALGPGRLYRNTGGARFKDVTKKAGVGNAGHWGTACAWVDYDRDGLLDLFIGNYVRYKLGSDTPCLYSEGYKSYCGPRWFQSDHPTLYRNLGAGRFEDVTTQAGLRNVKSKALGVSIIDHNGDLWPDLFVTNDVMEQLLLENVAQGKRRAFRDASAEAGIALTEAGHTLAGMGIDTVDLLGDGRLWIATSNFSAEGVVVFRQDSPRGPFREVSEVVGTKQPSVNLLGFGLLWVDVDNSSIPEIFVANGHVHPDVHNHQPHLKYEEPKLILEWDGVGRFRDVTGRAGPAITQPNVGRGLAAGDFDDDGRTDLLINNVARPAELLHNVRQSPNHWIGLQLEGRKSNRSGYGALVQLRAGILNRSVFSGPRSSYCSQSDPRIHFGLGAESRIDQIEIRWPSGVRDVIAGLPANRYYRIVEGSARGEPMLPATRTERIERATWPPHPPILVELSCRAGVQSSGRCRKCSRLSQVSAPRIMGWWASQLQADRHVSSSVNRIP